MKVDKLELLDHGPVQIRFTKPLFDGEGNEVSASYHRDVRNPGDDISDLPPDRQAVITAHWTADRIATYLDLRKSLA